MQTLADPCKPHCYSLVASVAPTIRLGFFNGNEMHKQAHKSPHIETHIQTHTEKRSVISCHQTTRRVVRGTGCAANCGGLSQVTLMHSAHRHMPPPAPKRHPLGSEMVMDPEKCSVLACFPGLPRVSQGIPQILGYLGGISRLSRGYLTDLGGSFGGVSEIRRVSRGHLTDLGVISWVPWAIYECCIIIIMPYLH